MFKNKLLLMWAIIVLIFAMILNTPFPHHYPFGEFILRKLNIPTQSSSGFFYVSIILIILLIVGLNLLVRSLTAYKVRFVLLALILFFMIPISIINTYQSLVAKGIYAVSYDNEISECEFDMIDEEILHGECSVFLQNHSNEDVAFTMEFVEHLVSEDDLPMLSLMNQDGAYDVTLQKKAHGRFIFEAFIDMSKEEEHIEGGSASYFNIIIQADGKKREL